MTKNRVLFLPKAWSNLAKLLIVASVGLWLTACASNKPAYFTLEKEQSGTLQQPSQAQLPSDGLYNQMDQAISRFNHTPYRYGGSTPNGTDCSGFTMSVFRDLGVILPRTASAQYQLGMSVQKDQLQKGDLVFFRGRRIKNKKVDHVGIYVGDNKMVHASLSRGVVQETLFPNQYFTPRYIGAKRILAEGAPPGEFKWRGKNN